MNNRYIQPVFTKDDATPAAQYLINKIYDEVQIDPSSIPEGADIRVIKYTLAANIVQNVYGCNIINIANYNKIEEYFYSYYIDSIMDYLKYREIEFNITDFAPEDLTMTILSNVSRHYKFIPLSRWDPSKYWEDFSYTKDVETNFTNPINEFNHVHLFIPVNDVTRRFLIEATSVDDALLKQTKSVMIQLLPTSSIRDLLIFMKVLHKYL